MPINYTVPGNDFASTLQKVNQASPTPDYNALDSISQAGAGSGIFGMTPAQTTQGFDDSFAKAESGYAPFQGDHSKIDQLQSLYGTVGSAFDVSGTLASLDKTRSANLLTGQQAANTASARFSESQPNGPSNAVGAAMVRAQSLLPFTTADTQAASDEGKYADTAKQNALNASAGIASSLAQLEQSYTDSLAKYNSDKANFGLNYAQGQTNLGLQASQLNTTSRLDILKNQAQIAENARQANLAAALQTRGQDLSAAQTATSQQIQAGTAYLSNLKAPSAAYTTNNNGQVTSGQDSYNAYQAYLKNRAGATGALANMAY